MPKPIRIRAQDYYISVSGDGSYPKRFTWKLCRKREPLGVKIEGTGFSSQLAAEIAGREALHDFIAAIYARIATEIAERSR